MNGILLFVCASGRPLSIGVLLTEQARRKRAARPRVRIAISGAAVAIEGDDYVIGETDLGRDD